MNPSNAYVPVAITTRSGIDESVHFGMAVGLDPSGEIEFAWGDPTTAIYARSSNKPMQAVAMLRAGLTVSERQLALVCASHDGTPVHLDLAREILAGAGLTESDLANTPDLPLDAESAEHVLRTGGHRTSLQQNCSGKHAGMLATCVANGWAHDPTYLDPEHPLQLLVTETITELAGEEMAHIGVDGCGAPAHVYSLVGLARAFRAIAVGDAGQRGRAVYQAMVAHPELVGGERREATSIVRATSGTMLKEGAEGVFAIALADGRAVAGKIADGRDRARPALMVAALRQAGVDLGEAVDAVRQVVLGHGEVVGEVRAIVP
jgi:L-asparaginase II